MEPMFYYMAISIVAGLLIAILLILFADWPAIGEYFRQRSRLQRKQERLANPNRRLCAKHVQNSLAYRQLVILDNKNCMVCRKALLARNGPGGKSTNKE